MTPIQDRKLLSERVPEWTEFANSDTVPELAPFLKPATWIPWLEANPDAEPAIFEKRDPASGKLTALFPMYQKENSLFVASDSHIDYQEIIATSQEAANAILCEVIDFCSRENLTLTLAKVAENSRLSEALLDDSIRHSASIQSRYWSSCSVGKFTKADPNEFLSCLSKKRKKNFKAAASRLRKELPGHVVEHFSGEEITPGQIFEIGVLHQGNQHRKDGGSVFLDEGFRKFLSGQAEANPALTLSTLKTEEDGELVAFNLGYFANDTYFYYIPSYEGNFAHLSPGSWLMIETLRHHYPKVEGDTMTFDLLSGSESYKDRWASEEYRLNRVLVFPKKLTNLPVLAFYSAVYGLKGLKNKIRGIG